MSLCRNRHLLGRKTPFHSMPPRSRIAILLQRRSLHLRSRTWILQLGHCPCRLFVKNKADQFQSIFNHFKRKTQGKVMYNSAHFQSQKHENSASLLERSSLPQSYSTNYPSVDSDRILLAHHTAMRERYTPCQTADQEAHPCAWNLASGRRLGIGERSCRQLSLCSKCQINENEGEERRLDAL